jgi:hypothetical protein
VNTGNNGKLTREQLCNILAVALRAAPPGKRRPLSTYEPLAWLLGDDASDRKLRRLRRTLYRKLVADLAVEFEAIYAERLVTSNGPWDFPDVYKASQRARKCIRSMRLCALQHTLYLPGACARSIEAYRKLSELLNAAAAAGAA